MAGEVETTRRSLRLLGGLAIACGFAGTTLAEPLALERLEVVAHTLDDPKLAPHLEFVDLGGHGYAKVRLTADEVRTEFVCIPRPIERSAGNDGGPMRYRVVHVAKLWRAGERPRLGRAVLEGDPGLA